MPREPLVEVEAGGPVARVELNRPGQRNAVSHPMLEELVAALGGNVRVGFEDNFYLPSGEMASSNGDLVEAAATIVRLQGREVAEPAEARRLLSLPAEPDRSTVLGA